MGIHAVKAADVCQQPPKVTLLRRNSSSFHVLHSVKKKPGRSYIWKKWKFIEQQQAEQKFKLIENKINDPQSWLLRVQDLEFSQIGSNSYVVAARLQYPARTLKREIEQRRLNDEPFTELQICSYLAQLCSMDQYFKSNSEMEPYYFPTNFSDLFLRWKNQICIKDPAIFSDIKMVSKLTKSNQKGNEQKIAHLIISMCLLMDYVLPREIYAALDNIEIQYGPSLTALLLKMCEGQVCSGSALAICLEIKKGCERKKEGVTNFKRSFCERKNWEKSEQSLITKSNIEPQRKTENVLSSCHQQTHSSKIIKSEISYRNLQKMEPKTPSMLISKQLFMSPNSERSEQNKENSNEGNFSSLKILIDPESHLFPKSIKTFRKTSLTSSEQNSESKHEKVNQTEFERKDPMKGFNNFNLLKNCSNQSLLESILESEESVVINNSESPVMNLDHEIEAMTEDFCKLQLSFAEADKYQEISLVSYAYQRNSTIIELTEENDQSDYEMPRDSFLHQVSRNLEESSIRTNEENQQFVIEHYAGGSRYEGYIVDGMRNGFGKLYYQDGGSYEGSWKNGEIEGFGKLFYQSGLLAYEGNWEKGEFSGEGKIINQNPEPIHGCFNFKDFSEIGTAWLWYQGFFQNDNKNGQGVLMLSNGEQFSGEWVDNNVEGLGKFVTGQKIVITGRWANNILEEELSRKAIEQSGI